MDVFETDVKKTNAHTKKVWKPLTSEEAALPSSIGDVWENPSTGDTQRGGVNRLKVTDSNHVVANPPGW